MNLPEVLQHLHRMQKETARLLSEAPVTDSEEIRAAVTKVDLALDNAASMVRQRVLGSSSTDGTPARSRRNRRRGTAVSPKAVGAAESGLFASGPATSTQTNESPVQAVSVAAVADEGGADVQQSAWDYLETIQHPDDRGGLRTAHSDLSGQRERVI